MANRSRTRNGTCTPVDAMELHRRLSEAFGVHPVAAEADVVSIAFPDPGDPLFRERYLLRELLRKYPDFDLGIDTHAVAIQALLDQERVNSDTNDRISARWFEGFDPRVRTVYHRACRKVANLLGSFSVDEWLEGVRFGPRATTRIRGESPNLSRKLNGRPHVTSSARELGYMMLMDAPMWASQVSACYDSAALMETREFETVISVPKNAKTGRTISPPVDMNGLGQLGLGRMIRRRLFRKGVNLNDQTVNQKLAKLASSTGEIATLDLKNASMAMVVCLVWDMVGNHPHDMVDPAWYEWLEALRTEWYMIDGELRSYELWSSMGNGYTFELESLIFWALCSATCSVLGIPEDNVSVYGDDLIVPVQAVELLRESLAWCGFELNQAKSFWNDSGPRFRESCGKHFLDGIDVTPAYVDQPLTTVDQVILLANNLLRWAAFPGGGRDGRVKPVYDWVVGHLPDWCTETCIPFGESNDGLVKDFDEACPEAAYTCASPTCTVKSQYVQDEVNKHDCWGVFKTRPMILQRMFLGYRATTVNAVSDARHLSDDASLYVWHYLKGVKRFTPPGRTPDVSLRKDFPLTTGLRGTELRNWAMSLEPYERYRAPTSKVGFREGSRVVTSWPFIGPWLM